ncbi:MAG TPA: FAD-dependent oxidoreductase, partial [Burkholderiales bacterium]|nr:FAD-dependent oxidoreductase [Burkholderiales bacterium]
MISTLVIGGGIGGLSVARELVLRGLPVTVLEKARALNPVGAGIIMNPNAMAVLERNGLAAALRASAWPYLARETNDARGRLLAVRDYQPLYESGKLARGALVHRAHLLDVLYGSVPREAVHFGASASRFRFNESSVKVETEDGRAFEADLVVGADGIHSALRRELFGEIAPRYMGYRSHRMVVDNEAGVRHFSEFLGRGQRIGLVPVSESRLYVWTTFNSPQARPPVFDGVEDFRRLFAQF